MALVDKITNIADSIRSKTGSSAKMTLDEMARAILDFNGEILLKPTEYPNYVRTEIMRVANEVRKVLKNDSFVSICMSDSHYPSLGTASLHALMAIKGLTHLIPVNFIAHLGDLGFEDGSNQTNTDYLASNILEILSYMDEGGADSIPLFAAIGNHDCGNYITAENKDDQLPAEWLYNHFTKLSASDYTVMAGENVGGYCYRDFPSNKIRVFLLNTAEGLITGGNNNDFGTSVTQRAWFASKLQELNNKSDAAGWGFIVLCHYPADYGSTRPLSNLLAAYVEGSSFTENGVTYNFSGKNSANFINQFHGHIHNYLYTKLYKGSTPTQYDAWRIGVPNSGDATRTNHNSTLSGINYAEEITQTKIPNTAEDTSFVVNVYNPTEEKIYSFNYGKGYSRIIGLGKITYYGITRNIENVEFSNDIISVESGSSYTATFTYPDDYLLETIKITMSGVDITDRVYSNNTINIPEVTGNVVIIAQAYKIPTTNLNRIAYEFVEGSTKIYNNGLGYKDNTRLSGGVPTDWDTEENAVGYVMTGRIPWDASTPIVIQGAELDVNDSACKFALVTPGLGVDWPIVSSNANNTPYSTVFTITYENGKTILTPKPFPQWATINGYFTITLKGTGRDLIITCGGITETQGFTVTNSLFNVSTNNSAYSVTENTSYVATLTPNEGYGISSVQVIMGGQVVNNAFNSATNTITINNVTGNITITATATLKNYAITNALTKVTSNNNTASITHGSSYSATLTPSSGHKMNSVVIKMGNTDITSSAYTSSNGKIFISSVTDYIVITAVAIEATYAATYNLTGASSSNTSTAISGTGYTTTIIPNDNYTIDSVTITMGGKNITSTAYNNSTGLVNIGTVTGDIVITVVASIYNWLLAAKTTPNGNTLYTGTSNGQTTRGYKVDTRLSTTDGHTEKAQAGYYITGYMRAKRGDIIRLKNIDIGTTSDGQVNIFVFDDTDYYANAAGWSFLNAGKSGDTITITNTVASAPTCFRIVAKGITSNSIITVNKEII